MDNKNEIEGTPLTPEQHAKALRDGFASARRALEMPIESEIYVCADEDTAESVIGKLQPYQKAIVKQSVRQWASQQNNPDQGA